ncbi:MAG TPA: YceI family protein [bacterium]|nr:YceI family protein [bacterium]
MRVGSMLIGGLLITMLFAPSVAEGLGLIPTGTFEIVPGDSSIVFAVPDNRGGFSGRTTQVTGRVAVAAGAAGETYAARVAATIDTGTITTGNALRDASMRATFLQTRQYPVITFAGTVTATPGLGVHPFPAAVRGTLTIRNVTRDVEFAATVTALAHEYLADATTTIRMADYQIPYPRAFIFVARDPVTLTLHIRSRQPDGGGFPARRGAARRP